MLMWCCLTWLCTVIFRTKVTGRWYSAVVIFDVGLQEFMVIVINVHFTKRFNSDKNRSSSINRPGFGISKLMEMGKHAQ